MQLDPRDRLIVALDVPSVAAAEAMVARLGESVSFYKIGYQLAFAGGLDLARALAGAGKQVFLDLKLHDIGNTVGRGRRRASRNSARRSSPCTPIRRPCTRRSTRAPGRACAFSPSPCSPPTTMPTSPPPATTSPCRSWSAERAAQARDIGVDGLVCSAAEAAMLRPIVGAGMTLVTPGIRPAGAEAGDQKRVMTPAAAIAAGADYLVVGRPILAAPDPKAAAEAIVGEIATATGQG